MDESGNQEEGIQSKGINYFHSSKLIFTFTVFKTDQRLRLMAFLMTKEIQFVENILEQLLIDGKLF